MSEIKTIKYYAKGEMVGEGWIGNLGLGDASWLYIKWINNKVLLYSTGNYIQYSVTSYNGKEYEKSIFTHI